MVFAGTSSIILQGVTLSIQAMHSFNTRLNYSYNTISQIQHSMLRYVHKPRRYLGIYSAQSVRPKPRRQCSVPLVYQLDNLLVLIQINHNDRLDDLSHIRNTFEPTW